MSVDQYKKEVGMMNLDNLIVSRESISTATFPIPDKELLSRFEQLYTGAVNDVLREFCLLDQALPRRILSLREYRTVAGFAFTVKSSPNVQIKGEMEFRTQMLDEIAPKLENNQRRLERYSSYFKVGRVGKSNCGTTTA